MATTNTEIEILRSSLPGQPSKEEIVALCREKGPTFNHLVYESDGFSAFIKYGNKVTLAEARNQLYAFEHTRGRGGAKIPEIYHAFVGEGGTYIVMEYVRARTVAQCLEDRPDEHDRIYEQVAQAVIQLLGIPVPEGSPPGPVGGGYIQHFFFLDHFAPRVYESVEDFQGHINKIIRRTPHKVDFSLDRLVFYYSDINEFNFLITDDNQLYVVDFQEAGFLPETMMSLVLHRPWKPWVRNISDRVDFPRSKALDAISLAAYYFHVGGTNLRPTITSVVLAE